MSSPISQSDTDSGRSSFASADSHSNASWVSGDCYYGNAISPVVALVVRSNGSVPGTNAISGSVQLHYSTSK